MKITLNVGDRYQDYKGEIVSILAIEKSENNVTKGKIVEWSKEPVAIATDNIKENEIVVFYSANSENVWARPLNIFNEILGDDDEGTFFYRFSKI